MRSKLTGFTLIELVVVIIILAILAAIAMPKLQNIDVDAKHAASKGAKGAIVSAAGITYGKNQSWNTLVSILEQTVLDDPKVSIYPLTCRGAGTTDSLFSVTYNNVFQFSFYMDRTLCSG